MIREFFQYLGSIVYALQQLRWLKHINDSLQEIAKSLETIEIEVVDEGEDGE